MIGGVLQRIGPQDSLGHPSNHSRKKKIYSSVKYTIEYIYGSILLSVRFLNNSSSLLLKEIRTELESISHPGTEKFLGYIKIPSRREKLKRTTIDRED